MLVNSRESLSDYVLKKLGSPVINIEVTEDQIDICIDEALSYFGKYHFDGYRETYLAMDIEAGRRDYSLDDIYGSNEVLEVLGVIDKLDTVTAEPTFTYLWDFQQERLGYGIHELDLQGYHFLQEKLRLIDFKLKKRWHFNFNYSTKLLTFHETPADSERILLKVYLINDPEIYTDIYNNEWLKRYVEALVRIQWGNILSKYENVPLPGGSTFGSAGILAGGKDMKKELEDELESRYRLPTDFFIG